MDRQGSGEGRAGWKVGRGRQVGEVDVAVGAEPFVGEGAFDILGVRGRGQREESERKQAVHGRKASVVKVGGNHGTNRRGRELALREGSAPGKSWEGSFLLL